MIGPASTTSIRWTMTNSTIRLARNEMDAAGRLAAAEQIQQPGKEGVDAGRHGQAGQHHQADQGDHAQIGQPLQHIVALGRFAGRMLEPDMIQDRAGNGFQVAPARPDIAQQMPRPQAVDQIDQRR